MTIIATILLLAGVVLIVGVRWYRARNPGPGDASVGDALLQLIGLAMAAGALIIFLVTAHAHAAESPEVDEPPEIEGPQPLEEAHFYLMLYCKRPVFVLWAGPRIGGIGRPGAMDESTFERVMEIRERAKEAGHYYLIRARGPHCPET